MDKKEYQEKEEHLSLEIFKKKIDMENSEDEQRRIKRQQSESLDRYTEEMALFSELESRGLSAETEIYLSDLRQRQKNIEDNFQELMSERLSREKHSYNNLEDDLVTLQRQRNRLDDEYKKSQNEGKHPWFNFDSF